jgi:SAM-dependent methyltransferase
MKTLRQTVEDVLDATVREEFRHFDLHVDGGIAVRDENPEWPGYLAAHRHEYVRTVCDVLEFSRKTGAKRVLEIGAFFGLVCITLKKFGLDVVAADIPEYMEMPEQIERFGRNGVARASVRLQDYLMPFEDERFDVVIMTEVLEHLNFNPVPLLKEINRIGAKDSLFYLSLPNLAYYMNRVRFLFGESMLQSIDTYFKQVTPGSLEIVNGHWREYTKAEVVEMLTRLGYTIEEHYFFSIVDVRPNPTPKNRLTRFVFSLLPSFKENQTTLAIRSRRSDLPLHIPKTVHATLRSV